MPERRIEAALADASDTEQVVIGPGAVGAVAEVFGRTFGERTAVVVADATTWRVAGDRVQRTLEAAGRATGAPYRFPPDTFVEATYGNVERLRASFATHHAVPVAVGSGSLNDLVKRAAHEVGRPYLSVATAASMDGYTAFGAAITRDGHKQTMTCPAPRAVVADLEVLAGAPADMTASGYGDLLGKVTAGADWLVADALGAEPVDSGVWELVQGPLRAAIGRPGDLAAGDREALRRLVEGLVSSGLAMQAHASSRPASGAEHQFSHLWEMEGLGHDRRPPLSHGFKVGVGSVAIAALYERLLARDLGGLDVEALRRAWPTRSEAQAAVRAAHTTPGLAEAAVAETTAKWVDADALGRRLSLLADGWPALRDRLREQLVPAERLRELLVAAGCPTRPLELGLPAAALRDTYRRARMIRRRYTVLDLAFETGLLGELVDELFRPGGFWSS
ncbi:MAG TPA: sn-glycerol-1-phosphate dehydrogenase [Actinomycetota bacterium]|jgi:glycerol-1-phosphate dehydrogenase [NAD(P)+]|nr:sn-glycerol-1-phosphate dehydrogenase [Actinomycetota bacterium]